MPPCDAAAQMLNEVAENLLVDRAAMTLAVNADAGGCGAGRTGAGINGADADAASTVLREISMFPRAFFVRRIEVRRHYITSAKSDG